MKTLFYLFTVYLFCNNATAQQKCAVVFNSYNSAGFIAGKLPIAFTAQTENGVKFKNWFVGAGFGVDNYYRITLPLFVALKKEFSFKKSSLFLYTNAGVHFIAKDKKITNTFSTVETQGGFYADAGLGYKIKTTHRSSVYFSLGNTLKNIRQKGFSSDPFGMPGIFVTEYKLSRISFRAGYQF